MRKFEQETKKKERKTLAQRTAKNTVDINLKNRKIKRERKNNETINHAGKH